VGINISDELLLTEIEDSNKDELFSDIPVVIVIFFESSIELAVLTLEIDTISFTRILPGDMFISTTFQLVP
jgi:hypothetical protein